MYFAYNNEIPKGRYDMNQSYIEKLLPFADSLYDYGEYVPLFVKRGAIRGLDGIVALETAAGKNTIPIQVGDIRVEYVYLNAASMLYFKLSLDDDRISHEVPYSMLDLPPEYDLAIDVGAHFGIYSVLLGALNELDVVCFEPSEQNRRVLAANMIHNGIDAPVDDRVVTGSDGEIAFYEGRKLASNDHTTTPFDDSASATSTRATVSLSTVIDDADVDAVFAKIDAEGEEDGIIEDLVSFDGEILSGLVELHPDLLDTDPDDVLERLTDAGFHVEPVPSVGNPIYRFANDVAQAIERAPSKQVQEQYETVRTEEKK